MHCRRDLTEFYPRALVGSVDESFSGAVCGGGNVPGGWKSMLVAVRGTAGVMTLRRVCAVRTRRVTGRCWVTVRCRRGWRLARAWRWRTVRSGRSGSRRGGEMAVDGRFAQGARGRRGGGGGGGAGGGARRGRYRSGFGLGDGFLAPGPGVDGRSVPDSG